MKATSLFRLLALIPVLCAMLVTDLPFIQPAFAQSVAKGASGLPLPRFVSLKSRRVNLRIGPSKDYAVEWMYIRSGIPMEIIQEYDHWRRVRDADGTEGWIHRSLLTGERSAITAPWKRGATDVHVVLRAKPLVSADAVAKLEPGVVISISQCNGSWCECTVQGNSGWVAQDEIWGVYPGEAFR